MLIPQFTSLKLNTDGLPAASFPWKDMVVSISAIMLDNRTNLIEFIFIAKTNYQPSQHWQLTVTGNLDKPEKILSITNHYLAKFIGDIETNNTEGMN